MPPTCPVRPSSRGRTFASVGSTLGGWRVITLAKGSGREKIGSSAIREGREGVPLTCRVGSCRAALLNATPPAASIQEARADGIRYRRIRASSRRPAARLPHRQPPFLPLPAPAPSSPPPLPCQPLLPPARAISSCCVSGSPRGREGLGLKGGAGKWYSLLAGRRSSSEVPLDGCTPSRHFVGLAAPRNAGMRPG